MPVLRRVRLHRDSRRQQHAAVGSPADARAQDACRPRPVFSSAQRTGAAFGTILRFAAVHGSDLNFHHAEFAADLNPITARRSLPSARKGKLQNKHEDGAQPRQPPEKPGAADERYEKGARHLLQDSLAAFAADTRGNFRAVI
ncbi:hypothetical protein [Leisingera sp. M523]|uniref:hypothetical protein n=1 Tax=Leisingera sp. M523 TaxID=2867013 RepID=UPI0021A79DCF|nr:hypothetical protein [Leisingera sp. M523]UWQ29409.1 hypothetical protein K3557_02280 [Leisingera sp. M523]